MYKSHLIPLSLFDLLDIDECEDSVSKCSHTCTNTPGSYTCGCHEGHVLSEDGLSCEGKHNF